MADADFFGALAQIVGLGATIVISDDGGRIYAAIVCENDEGPFRCDVCDTSLGSGDMSRCSAAVRRLPALTSSAMVLDVSRFSSGPLRPKMVMKEIWNGTSL